MDQVQFSAVKKLRVLDKLLTCDYVIRTDKFRSIPLSDENHNVININYPSCNDKLSCEIKLRHHEHGCLRWCTANPPTYFY